MEKRESVKKTWWEPLLVVFLFWYPLRHIYWGIDWWDTGYNYANFTYMGLEHMDPMWFFATYLANAVGKGMTMLPGGGTLAGMNLYTGLVPGVLAVMGYLFCTRKLKIPEVITFVGEFAALSLCWCPTAVLYNYLTYVFFLACVILLYIGLTEKRRWCLAAAGVCLGLNVLVRFSNLPEAAMILAVWVYAFMEGAGPDKRLRAGFVRAAGYTGWCLGGYLAALAAGLGLLHIRYGLSAYVSGVARLFAMTEVAADYKPTSMLSGLVEPYLENLYWAARIGVIAAVGFVGYVAVRYAASLLLKGDRKRADRVAQICVSVLAVLMLAWFYERGFCSLEFNTYGPMRRPGVLFLMLTMGIAVLRIFSARCPLREKLISGMLILVILLTALGSNNKEFPSLNNLFVAAPYTLWQCCRFIGNVHDWDFKWGSWVSIFPFKALLMAFLAMFLAQIGQFGMGFVFAEGTGVSEITHVIENNDVLAGIRMSPERAEVMSGISAYVAEQDLAGQEVILYGSIPALSYYLQMPSAFNPWSDLPSYQYEVMERDLRELEEEITEGGAVCPVVILENKSRLYLQGGVELLLENGVSQMEIDKMYTVKLDLLADFMEKFNYDLTYENGKFALYQTAE
ncbi:MAG: hypothetical protein NC079_06100 [Clostridium sp.]|nr:hypothetical protein [Acetatifactor muris]MCM1527003.1 hypothetical protein [Bacteroides sp.]MCM1563166.1 hypothetical protein [Clostridium sp.]